MASDLEEFRHTDLGDAYGVEHPNGKTLLIAKNTLDPETHDLIKATEEIPKEEHESFFKKLGRGIGKDYGDVFGSVKNVGSTLGEPVVNAAGDFLQGLSGYTPAKPTPQPQATPYTDASAHPLLEGDTSLAKTSLPAQEQVPAQVKSDPFAMPTAQDLQRPFEEKRKSLDLEKKYADTLAGEQAKQYQNLLEQQRLDEAAYKSREDDRHASEQALMKDMLDPTKQIDPGRTWQNMGTGNKILAALSMLVSVGGSGERNSAVRVLNETIDRDVEAQAKNIANRNSNYQRLIDAGKSDAEAQNISRTVALQKVDMTLRAFGAQNAGLKNNALYQDALSKLDQEINNQKMQYAKIGLDQRISSGNATLQELTMYGTPEQQAVVVPIPGTNRYLKTGSSDARKEVSTAIGVHKSVLDKLRLLGGLGPAAMLPAGDAHDQAMRLKSGIINDLRNTDELSRPSPEAIKLITEQFEDPTRLKSLIDNPAKGNKEAAEILTSSLRSKITPKILNPELIPLVFGESPSKVQSTVKTSPLGTRLKNAKFNK